MKHVEFLCCLAFLLVFVGAVVGGIAPENVCIVVNGDSDSSKTIAEVYMRLRRVPANNIVTLTGIADKEKTTVEEFRQKILGPVLRTLQERGLRPQIDLIAYSSDIPTAVDVSQDIGSKKLPRVLTPVASVNGLTFLHQAVMEKDIAYLDLNANRYARREFRGDADTPWAVEERTRYVDALAKLQEYADAVGKRKEGESVTDEQKSLLDEAATTMDELKKLHPKASELHYNCACVLAQLDRFDAAIAALQEAVKLGWSDTRQTERDDDLKALRERADFQTLLAEMKTRDIAIQPAVGFRSSIGWRPNGEATSAEKAPRYLLSTVLASTSGRGMSVEDAAACLHRAGSGDGTHPKGTIYFERNGDVRSTTREWAFRGAARKLESLGVKAVIEEGVLPREKSDVAGGVIGTSDFDWTASGSKIVPGAIVEHLTSFGGMMAKGAGQTPLTEFLKHGAAGSSGTVTEPFAIQAKFPSPYIHVHYASGCTLAEAYYQSVTGPYQLLIVGDPLAQPWRRNFSISVDGFATDASFSGDVTLQPKTESGDNIAPAAYELYIDGFLTKTVKPGESLTWDTRQLTNGKHILTVLARGDDAVQTVARWSATVTVQN
jgi:tetratricopeptide (TPR) repeat protein